MREKRFWASELAADAVTLAKGVAKQKDVAMTAYGSETQTNRKWRLISRLEAVEVAFSWTASDIHWG